METDNWVRHGAWVAERRLAKGLTQEDLAELVGLERQQIYRIENGWSSRRSTVIRIARALGANPDEAINLAFGMAPPPSQHKQPLAEGMRLLIKLSPEGQEEAIAIMGHMVEAEGLAAPETIIEVETDEELLKELGEPDAEEATDLAERTPRRPRE